MIKKIIVISLVTLSSFSSSFTCEFLRGKSFLKPRSQSMNVAREMVGWQQFLYQCDNCLYTAFAVTPQYSQSFRAAQIAEYFFGTDTLCISGSEVDPRGENDILADYFGLSPQFISTVQLQPKLRNALINLSWYIGYNCWYFRMHAPIVWARSEIELDEVIESIDPTSPYPALYMDENEVAPAAQSFKQAIRGGLTYGQVVEGIQFGKIGCPQHEQKLSDIRMTLGWNFINNENGYLGFNLQAAAPTGTRPDVRYLFEPIVGNGHHWEFGFGMIGYTNIWEGEVDNQLDFYVDSSITHFFKDRQQRSFDLKPEVCECDTSDRRFGSRYILMKEFDETGAYIGQVVPGINRLTLCADVSVDIQFDITVMFAWQYKQFTWNFGYEGWVRSREKICLKENFPENRFGLKGIQNVITPIGQNSIDTQSSATLHGNNLTEQALVVDMPSPVFIEQDQIDITSGRASRAFTNKIFSHSSYNWDNGTHCWIPFLGIGGEIEFEGDHSSDQESKPNKNAISQWSIWLKGGIVY